MQSPLMGRGLKAWPANANRSIQCADRYQRALPANPSFVIASNDLAVSNLYPHFPVWFRGYNQEPKSRCGQHAIDINVHLLNNVAQIPPFTGHESTCP
ncbi:MAG: hypothetical protein CMJ59_05745 [Planctomycetaceae bacterium]|nr:hypothetical protein [Planctomycetaceae bacterium]